MDFSQLYGELKGQCFATLSSAMRLTIDARAAYTAHLDDQVVMPYANMDAKTVGYVNHKHDYSKANYTDLGASVRADYALPGGHYGLFAGVTMAAVLCSLGTHQLDLHASVGITF